MIINYPHKNFHSLAAAKALGAQALKCCCLHWRQHCSQQQKQLLHVWLSQKLQQHHWCYHQRAAKKALGQMKLLLVPTVLEVDYQLPITSMGKFSLSLQPEIKMELLTH